MNREYTPQPDRYQHASFRRCGRSGLSLPSVSLGLWHNFGGVDCYETARDVVQRAFDLGVTHFDLANNYGPPPGSAEETFGRILRDGLGPHRDELIVSTKAGYTMWPGPYGDFGSRKYLLASLDQSLKRMGIEYVDIFYHHRPDPDTPLEESLGAVAHAVRSGKALYAGISNYPPDLTRVACQMLREMGTPCLIHQARYSMLDRWVENGLLDVLGMDGVGFIAFSPLAQGLLTDRYLNGVPGDSRIAKGIGFLTQDRLTDDTMTKVRQLQQVAARRGQSLAQLALSWVLRDPRVTSVLIGASSVAQLEANLACMRAGALEAGQFAAIEDILG